MSDLISRQAAIDALKGLSTWWADEGGYYGGAQPPMVALLDPEDAVSAIENMPSAQPQLEECPIYGGMCGYPSNLCYECPRHEGAKEQPQWWTEGLQPFAQPQRMKGKWDARGWNNAYWKCSNCDELTVFPFDFCPFCGSDMRGDEDAAD